MEDLYHKEQQVYDRAAKHMKEIHGGAPCSSDEFTKLVKEYGRLLKEIRRVTKISDKNTNNLNISRLDLLDKVHYDALTGIYNRRFMEDNLKHVVKSVARTGNFLSVMMIDIDYFKKFNDTYGHGAGDTCLQIVAKALAGSTARQDDFVCRYGGEEFAVILPCTDKKGACVIAERLLENVRDCNIAHEKNDVAPCVTVSIGVTTGVPDQPTTGMEYIKRADTALYMSKQNGRNRYTFIDFEEETK